MNIMNIMNIICYRETYLDVFLKCNEDTEHIVSWKARAKALLFGKMETQ